MSEPVKLYRDGDELTVYAPSEVRRMIAEGWDTVDNFVPFAFNEPETYVNEADFANITSMPDVVPVKRGRPRKAK